MTQLPSLLKLLPSGVAFSAIAAYLLICLGLLRWQNRLIFVPSRTLEATPRHLGLFYEDVRLPVLTWEGKVERLHGWWIPAASHQSGQSPVLLYLHGNGGNISTNLGQAQRFQQWGFSVFLIDYRGYGDSQGQFPTEAEVYRDAQAAWDYLVQRRRIEPADIFIYGHSLGGAIAIDLAVRQPQAAGVMVENTFTSLREMADRESIYRLFPVDWLLNHRFDSLSKLRLLQVPLLLIHGLADRTVPPEMGQRLYEAASVPKRQLLVPEADHNNVAALREEEYRRAVEEFYQLARQQQEKTTRIGR